MDALPPTDPAAALASPPDAPAGGPKKANGLGIASLIIGILALLLALLPGCGLLLVIPLVLVGAVLGAVGLFAASSDKQTGVGFPVAGLITNAAAPVVGFVMLAVFAGGAAASMQELSEELERAERQRAAERADPDPQPDESPTLPPSTGTPDPGPDR